MEMNTEAMVENGPQCSGKDDVITSINNVSSSTTSAKDSCNDKNREEPPPKRVSHHRHKGTPQRARFF